MDISYALSHKACSVPTDNKTITNIKQQQFGVTTMILKHGLKQNNDLGRVKHNTKTSTALQQ
jgi:hypothetical protein